MLKQHPFYCKPCGKACQLSCSSNDPMAGHDNQQRIARTCAADGARSLRHSQIGSKLAVCPRFAKGNLIQPCPHSTVKFRSILFKWQIKRRSLAHEILRKLAPRFVQCTISIICMLVTSRKAHPAKQSIVCMQHQSAKR